MHTKLCPKSSRKETIWETGVDGRIIFKWILEKHGMVL